MIETKNLSKRFNGVLAVDRLDLSVESGEVFAFLGPNGAGKTTTIRLLCGLIAPTEGEAVVAGCRIGEDENELRRRVGILTESPGLYDGLSAVRNLAFFAELYDVHEVQAQVERYLRMLGLWDRRDEPVGTFSKGMRQKLAIARAILHEPQVLFLDEPTSGLDPEAARLVRDFILELKRQGRTFFICTHNLEEADRLSDRIAVFNQRLLALDTPLALRRALFGRKVVFHLKAFKPEYLETLRGSFDFIQDIVEMEGRLVVTINDPELQNPLLVNKLVDLGAEIQFVGELRRSLEEVYLKLVQENHD
jgi:ABC-2 type transport system ATP-binding protein